MKKSKIYQNESHFFIFQNQPKVFIEGPAEIGDMEEYLFVQIENLGCFSLDLAWTVDAIERGRI